MSEYKRDPVVPEKSESSQKRKFDMKLMRRGLVLVVIGLVGVVGFIVAEHHRELWDKYLGNPEIKPYLHALGYILCGCFIAGCIGAVLVLVGAVLWIKNTIQNFVASFNPEKTRQKIVSFLTALRKMFHDAGMAGPRHNFPFDEELRRLSKLHKEGVITDAEFEEAKKKILARIE